MSRGRLIIIVDVRDYRAHHGKLAVEYVTSDELIETFNDYAAGHSKLTRASHRCHHSAILGKISHYLYGVSLHGDQYDKTLSLSAEHIKQR